MPSWSPRRIEVEEHVRDLLARRRLRLGREAAALLLREPLEDLEQLAGLHRQAPSRGSWANGTGPSRARPRTRAAARAGFRARHASRSALRTSRPAKVAPLAHRQRAERDAAAAHALQSGHHEADQLAHAADLALAALAQREAQLVLVRPTTRARASASRRRAPGRGAAASSPRRTSVPSTRTRYSFSTSESLADQALGDAAVLREHDAARWNRCRGGRRVRARAGGRA